MRYVHLAGDFVRLTNLVNSRHISAEDPGSRVHGVFHADLKHDDHPQQPCDDGTEELVSDCVKKLLKKVSISDLQGTEKEKEGCLYLPLPTHIELSNLTSCEHIPSS